MAQSSKRIDFPGASGEQLVAKLDMPEGKPSAYALWAHCFSCSKDILAASRVAKGLTDQGIAVFRFDFTGLGSSDGDFANTNFSSNIEDLVAAANYMREFFEAPQILIGHSWGGAAVLAAASNISEVKGVCTIAAPVDPSHVTNIFKCSVQEIEERGEAEVLLAGRPFKIKKQFLDDIADHKLEDKIAKLDAALLVMHSPTDNLVGVDNAGRIFAAAKHPKSFVTLDHADHMLSKREDAAYVASVIATWAARYVSTNTAKPNAKLVAESGTVVVAENGKGKFGQDISIGGRHRLISDEPKHAGGDDTGPTPYELLLAGLGACKTMTMRMYAEHKGYPLDRTKVVLRHSKEAGEGGGKIDRISVEVEVFGEMNEETRSNIASIADKCPVHRTLQSTVLIDSVHKG